MKFCIAFTLAAAAFESAMGLSAYLKELPNGDSFSQELGHPDNDSSQYTKFATAFAAAGHSWTTDFCGDTFPGSDMTNGAAFGDPCCTWAKGGTPDFTVTAFTTTPGEATVCESDDSSAGSSATSSGSTETEAPSTDTPTTDEPSATTEAPVTDTPDTLVPVTDPPIDSGSASENTDSSDGSFPRPDGCRVKPHRGGEHGGRARQFSLRR